MAVVSKRTAKGLKIAGRLAKASVDVYAKGHKRVAVNPDESIRTDQPAVVLLHGFSGGNGELLALEQSLVEGGYSVSRIFWSPVGLSWIAEISYWCHQLCELLHVLNKGAGVHLVGHSMGGLVCAEVELGDCDYLLSYTAIASPWVAPQFRTLPWTPKVVQNSFYSETPLTQPGDVSKWMTVSAGDDITVPRAQALVKETETLSIEGFDHTSVLHSSRLQLGVLGWINKQQELFVRQQIGSISVEEAA